MSEYVLKGIFLGLLLYVAVQEPDGRATVQVVLCTVGGLAVFLGIAAWSKLKEGYRVGGRLPAFILFLILESPELVYAGTLLGMVVGAYVALPRAEGAGAWPLITAVGGGVLLGIVFALLRGVRQASVRLGLGLLLAAVLVGGILYATGQIARFPPTHPVAWHDPTVFSVQLLLGIPIFYLLTFAGKAEESEVEIGAVCAALAVGLAILAREYPSYQSLGLLFAVFVYVFYTTRVLPGLRVFKHSIRGFSYAKIGRHRQALQSFRRALQLDPANSLAREGVWSVHRAMDPARVAEDPQTLALIDVELCMERVRGLLLQPGANPEAKLKEAHHLLDLVLYQKPEMRPVVDYWRAVAFTHARDYERAAAELEHVLDGSQFPPADPYRESVLLMAWQLALTLQPELNRRVGTPQLAVPGRRMEAIAAVERHLAGTPDDAAVWDMKRTLYSGLTEGEYRAGFKEGAEAGKEGSAVPSFDYGYAQQLGLALINDQARWERGAEYLRIAARGLPALAPSLLYQIAQAHYRAGHADEVWQYYELVKQAGRSVGPKNLGEEERQVYFAVLKVLTEEARERGQFDAAIENYQLFAENERSGVETLRVLADLYERKGDAFGAVRATEQALLYNPKDKDLLERKDRYYYSVMPDDLRNRPESARGGFDVDYCLRKARSLLDYPDGDLDLIDWAEHLLQLVVIMQPNNLSAKVLRARALRRRGEIDACREILEEVYANKPEKFENSADEENWFLACRLLGEMYLYDLGKPDQAVPCLTAFRKSSKSGADTLYKLGQAYEQIGDRARAKKCYEHVTSYDNHPLAPEAREALYRLQSS